MFLESNRCAVKELCICKAAGAPDGRRRARPACQGNVHAICGELCEDAGLMYHTTCFPCFAQHQRTFESPDDFQLHVSVNAAADRQKVAAAGGHEVYGVPSAMAVVTQVTDVEVEDILMLVTGLERCSPLQGTR